MKQGGNPSGDLTQSKTRRSGWYLPSLRESREGFTIVETLIVLVVTSALAVSALVIINGNQNRNQFTTSLQDLRQQMQQISNEVANGYFPANAGGVNSFSCTGNAPSSPTVNVATSAAQGSNQGCVFLGKVAHFGVGNGSGNSIYTVYSMVGNRLDQNLDEVTNLYNDPLGNGGAEPIAISQVGHPKEQTTTEIHNGLTLKNMYYDGSPANTVAAFGYLTSFGSYNGSTLVSGTQSVGLYAVKGSTFNPAIDNNTAIRQIDGSPVLPISFTTTTGNIVSATQITMCFDSATSNQYGIVTLGGTDQQLSVTTQIKDGSSPLPGTGNPC